MDNPKTRKDVGLKLKEARLEKGMKNLINYFNISGTRNKLYKRGEKYADYILVSHDISVKDFKKNT